MAVALDMVVAFLYQVDSFNKFAILGKREELISSFSFNNDNNGNSSNKKINTGPLSLVWTIYDSASELGNRCLMGEKNKKDTIKIKLNGENHNANILMISNFINRYNNNTEAVIDVRYAKLFENKLTKGNINNINIIDKINLVNHSLTLTKIKPDNTIKNQNINGTTIFRKIVKKIKFQLLIS